MDVFLRYFRLQSICYGLLHMRSRMPGVVVSYSRLFVLDDDREKRDPFLMPLDEQGVDVSRVEV